MRVNINSFADCNFSDSRKIDDTESSSGHNIVSSPSEAVCSPSEANIFGFSPAEANIAGSARK